MSWIQTKISDFLFERKGRFKPNDKEIIGLNRIEKIDFSGKFHLGNKPSNTDMILIKQGDLVISGINVAKGAMGIYNASQDVAATIHYSSYTFDETKINVEYFKRFLKSQVFINLLNEQVKGGIKTEIKAKHLLPLKVNLPNIERQNEIVKNFEKVENEIEDLDDEILHQKKLLQKFRQSILQEAIEGKLTAQWRKENPDVESALKLLEKISDEKERLIKEGKIKKVKSLINIQTDDPLFDIPKTWSWCRLETISIIGTGATPLTSEPQYYNGDINWMTSGATGHDFVYTTEKKITQKAIDETNCKVYPIGTLIVAMYGEGKTRGQITELQIEAATNQACAAIIFYYQNVYLRRYIKSYFQKIYLEIRKLASGGAQPNLNMEKIKRTMIALPPLQEQKVIVEKIENLFTICDEIERQINESNINVKMLMQAVLKEAFESKKEEAIEVYNVQSFKVQLESYRYIQYKFQRYQKSHDTNFDNLQMMTKITFDQNPVERKITIVSFRNLIMNGKTLFKAMPLTPFFDFHDFVEKLSEAFGPAKYIIGLVGLIFLYEEGKKLAKFDITDISTIAIILALKNSNCQDSQSLSIKQIKQHVSNIGFIKEENINVTDEKIQNILTILKDKYNCVKQYNSDQWCLVDEICFE